ncbi:MAG: EthD domain-containing protein [Gammaproteobacteria bacterium]|nr:EthD domain-containing protein [Gammaproteobacteria bacterium]
MSGYDFNQQDDIFCARVQCTQKDVLVELFSSQPVVKKYVRRYVQSRTVADIPEGYTQAGYDGVAQIWFDDIAGFNGVFASQNYRNVIHPDEERFVDGKRCELLFSEETPIID